MKKIHQFLYMTVDLPKPALDKKHLLVKGKRGKIKEKKPQKLSF